MIPANTTSDATFSYFPRSTGEHVLMLATDTTRTNILFTDTVKVLSSVSYSLSLDSMVIDAYKNSTLYGNTLRFRFKLSNKGSVDYDDYVRPLLRKTTWYDTRKFLAHIPAGGSQWFEMESNDLRWNHEYGLTINVKSKSSDDANILPNALYSKTFKPTPGIRIWKKDGKMHAQAPVTKKFTVPEDALAVDFTAPSMAVPSNIVPNSNPNTFYYVTKSYASLADRNQIVNLAANKIVLTDGYSCFIPRDFTAAEISYTRTFEKGFMGVRNQNNWSTIVLPFDVQTITNTTNDQVVDWFKPGQNKDKNFWLRRFYGEEGYCAYFTNAETFKAGMPYIITVPGDYKGEEYSLVGKPLTFSAVDVTVKKGKTVADAQNFDFEGSLAETTTKGKYVYQLDEEMGGNNFVYISTSSTVKPFRAYFTSESEPLDGAALYVASYIDVFEDTDAISDVNISTSTNHGTLSVYSISGSKVKTQNNTSVSEALQSLPRGIYIINGKKYIR
jgi:hypothetical protein